MDRDRLLRERSSHNGKTAVGPIPCCVATSHVPPVPEPGREGFHEQISSTSGLKPASDALHSLAPACGSLSRLSGPIHLSQRLRQRRTVAASNAAALLSQWTNVHGVSEEVFTQTALAGHRRRAWSNSKGDTVIELYLIDGGGHGTPVRRTKAQAAAGGAGPYMLDVGLSSTLHLARSWGLVRQKAASRRI